jgi:hypothetical protein
MSDRDQDKGWWNSSGAFMLPSSHLLRIHLRRNLCCERKMRKGWIEKEGVDVRSRMASSFKEKGRSGRREGREMMTTDRQIDRQTERQTDRHTDGQTSREAG